MNIMLEAQEIGTLRRRNKILTLLVMSCFALSLAFLGYGFDYLMGRIKGLQVVTIPVAFVFVGSLLYNLVNGLNERLFRNSPHAIEDPAGEAEYEKNKILIWMAWTTFLVLVWELSFLGQHIFGAPRPLLVLSETSPYGLLAGGALGIGAAFSTLQWGAYSILQSVEAQPADNTFEADALLLGVVEEICRTAAIPMPATLIVPDEAPNAFAVGRSPKHASLVVSQGLIENLTRDEIKGVIAHEISHIRSYDIRPRTAVTALFGSAILLSHGVENLALPKVGGVKRVLLLMFWIASFLAVPAARTALIVLTFRHREYLADASAAKLTQDPRALAAALLKIQQSAGSSIMIKGNVAHLCIIDPLNGAANSKEGWLADLLATHPPTTKRILVLESMVPRRAPHE
jgi:heat shock protein HtpX